MAMSRGLIHFCKNITNYDNKNLSFNIGDWLLELTGNNDTDFLESRNSNKNEKSQWIWRRILNLLVPSSILMLLSSKFRNFFIYSSESNEKANIKDILNIRSNFTVEQQQEKQQVKNMFYWMYPSITLRFLIDLLFYGVLFCIKLMTFIPLLIMAGFAILGECCHYLASDWFQKAKKAENGWEKSLYYAGAAVATVVGFASHLWRLLFQQIFCPMRQAKNVASEALSLFDNKWVARICSGISLVISVGLIVASFLVPGLGAATFVKSFANLWTNMLTHILGKYSWVSGLNPFGNMPVVSKDCEMAVLNISKKIGASHLVTPAIALSSTAVTFRAIPEVVDICVFNKKKKVREEDEPKKMSESDSNVGHIPIASKSSSNTQLFNVSESENGQSPYYLNSSKKEVGAGTKLMPHSPHGIR